MEQIIVTHLDTTTLKLNSSENISRIIKAEQTVELLGQDVVNVSVESARKLTFSLGDKITVIGRDYTLNTPPVERKFSETRFIYELQFEGVQYDMLRASFSVNVDTTNNQIQDLSGNSLTGDLKLFLDVLMSNLNRVFPSKWVLGVYPNETETRTETFSDTDNCLSVLQTLCSQDKFNTEFDIEISQTGVRTLNIRQTGKIHAHTFSYGKGKGVYELSRQKVSNSNIINRLWVFGGSKNILTTRYRAFKLCLPSKGKGASYLEDAASIAKYGVWEGTKNFDEIFPTRTGSITALGNDELEFIDTSMDFDLNETDVNDNTLYLMAGAKAKIKFKTGNLAGFEFEIESYDHATKKFRLLSQTDENDYTFPSPDSAAFRFSVTDQYTITDIALPQSYETAAEQKLEDAGEAYLTKFSQPLVSYGLRLDPSFLRDIAGEDVNSNIVWVGDFIPVLDADLDVDKTIRVKAFTRDLMSPFSYDITIADLTVTTTTISRVITDLKDVVNVIKINNLKDPARSRRNWLAAQELLNMVFDAEGDYYTDKIKPASIDTIMLSVGAKSMQFALIGTVFQPNYAGNANRIVYRGGTLQHYTIDPNGAKSWTLTDGDVTFPSPTTAYYIYAKVERSGTAGSILFSTSQISVEQDGAYYHFWIGVISSVDSILNTRLISLTYGFTTINGRYISTGRIQSADGLTYFDLDQGVIQGTLKFSSGQSVEDAIQEAVETNSFWSIGASSPVIYKDAASAAISGSHTSVVLTGELTVGNSTSYGGYISVTPNGGTESSPQASPVTLQPANADGKTSYLIKLYDDAVKTTLLDSMTIPVVFKGATGVSAINVVQSNEADVLPASVDGVVSSYVGSGNIIRVFEGSTELSYDGIGTAAGKFNVTGVGTNVTVGTKATSGNGVSFGVVSGMNADLAYITFTISGKTSAGTSFSFTKVQNFSKARAGATGADGPQGVAGPAGSDGLTYYTWIRYADDAVGTGISNSPVGKEYIGFAYNKTTDVESNTPSDYIWSLIKGETGDQGVAGPAGANGVTTYTWIKYSDNADGTGLYDVPTASTQYIGIAVNKTTQTESTLKTDYTWSRFKGDQGVQGIAGPAGADGVTYYTWVKYADTPTTGMSDYPSGKAYLGIAYNKTTATESTNYADYSWSLIKGDQGIQGPAGTNGVTTYTWIKYSDYSDGTSLYDTPSANTQYIGIAVNKTTATESTVKTDYTWSKFKGDQGVKGDKGDQGIQGIPGAPGADGITYYTWVKYADSPTTGMSDYPSGKAYLGIAHNKTTAIESTNYADYTWSLIKGDQGVAGPAGTDGVTTYTWIKYSNYSDGTSLYDVPTSATLYIGIAVNKTTATESTNKADYTWSRFRGYDGSNGTNGTNGISVTSVVVEYAQSVSATVAPTTGWSSTAPTWLNGYYIWARTTTYFSDNSYSTTTPVNVTGGKGETGTTGATGSAGRGVSNVQEEYYLSTSDSTQTGGSWSTTPPAWQEGKFIWTRIKVTYVDPAGTGYTTAVLASEWTAIQQAALAADGYMNARYIRDWLNGWTDQNGSTGTDKRFNEIQVFLKAGTNIAQGKSVTSNGTNNASYPLTRVTDGNTTNYAIPTIGSTTACYVQVDLGKVYYDISHIIVFHDSSNGKTFNGTKTEISMDGVNWVRIYDSATQGLYKEGLSGNRLSMLKTELYAKTVEAKSKTDFMTTIDGGLIYTALMKLFDTQGLNETAFISGQQGSGQDLPVFGAGGTYANALALATFLGKMIAGTTPSAGEYDQLPSIVMLHNGAAKIGDFIVEESGRIVLVDPFTGKPRLVFNVSDLPTLATLASGTTYGSTTNFIANSTTTEKVLTGSINVTQAGATINFQASLLEITASANSGEGFYPAASAVVQLLLNGSYYRTLGTVGVQVPYGGSNYGSGSINQTITGCPAGTYTIKLIAQGSPEIYSKLAEISTSSLSWNFTQSGVRYMQIGLNGLMAYFSNNHLYFTESGGLDVRGATNIPGVLLAGVVGSAGGFNLWWGAKKAAGTCTRTATGTYTVYHNVGHTLYAVQITCEWGPFAAHVLNKTATSFDVKLYRTDGTSALVNTEFSFSIVGNNYP